jgi:NTE family protein
VTALDADPVADLLRGVPFFRGLDRVDLARLLGALEAIRAGPGEVIAHEGTEADALFLLERGLVAITVASPDGEMSLREVSAPAHFGELGLLLARRTATSRALTDVVAWRLPRARFESLVKDRPRSPTRWIDGRASTSARPSPSGARRSAPARTGRHRGA